MEMELDWYSSDFNEKDLKWCVAREKEELYGNCPLGYGRQTRTWKLLTLPVSTLSITIFSKHDGSTSEIVVVAVLNKQKTIK